MLWLYEPKHGLVSDCCLKPNLFKASVQECGCVPRNGRCGREDKKGGNIQVSRRFGLVPHQLCSEKPWRLQTVGPGHVPSGTWPVPSHSFPSALLMPAFSLTAEPSVMPTHTHRCPWFIKKHERFKSYLYHLLTISSRAGVFPICIMGIIKVPTSKWDNKCET